MKHRLLLSVFLSLVMISSGLLPFQANAQNYADGTMVSQEEYYRWLQSHDSTLRQRVNQLDADPVVNLPMPILFGVAPSDLSPNFGDPRSGGRTHEGEDIMAPRDALIVSPTEAVVLSTGVWTGAGNQVSTANPGGEIFVYMHLDKPSDLKTGDVLKAGDLIGYVGNTGNAAGGPTHLHFEIRKNNAATDPFPRLKAEFTLAQKIKFVQNIIDDAKNPDILAQFLVTNYRSQFLAAQAVGINVPSEITAKMKRVPAAGAANIVSVPARDLKLGTSGADVIWLQTFLAVTHRGPASEALSRAGSTGYFGAITKAALVEYQAKAGISPAAGYFGPTTRAYMTTLLKVG